MKSNTELYTSWTHTHCAGIVYCPACTIRESRAEVYLGLQVCCDHKSYAQLSCSLIVYTWEVAIIIHALNYPWGTYEIGAYTYDLSQNSSNCSTVSVMEPHTQFWISYMMSYTLARHQCLKSLDKEWHWRQSETNILLSVPMFMVWKLFLNLITKNLRPGKNTILHTILNYYICLVIYQYTDKHHYNPTVTVWRD